MQSVDRAIEILQLVSTMGNATTGELAQRLNVHKSTASRLLSSLADYDLVDHTESGAYRLGFGLVKLAGSAVHVMDFSQVAQRLCEQVAADLRLTANVAVLDECYAVNVSQAVGPGLLAPRHYIGIRTPGHSTSSGKMLLALDPQARETALAPGALPLERHTAATITDPDVLLSELDLVRRQDWAAVNEEWEDRVTAVAVPLRQPDGGVEAALTVTAPTHALPPESFATVAKQLQKAASRSGRWL